MTKSNNNIINIKGGRYYLINILLFLSLLIAADLITGSFFKYLYSRQSSGYDYESKYSIEETKADVLIFGASRAQQQYIPNFIEDSLGLTCYNVGRDGMPTFYHYGVLQAVLKRYTPKIILLDCEYGVLKKAESSYERLSYLLPFYKTHPELRPIIELRSPYEKYKLISQTYPYNSLIFKILLGNLPSGKKKNATIKGFVPLTHSLNESIKTFDYSNEYETDTLKVKMMQSFINDCLERHIKLFLIVSPYYLNSIGTDYSVELIKEKALASKIDFLDYSKEQIFLANPKLFDDTVHVNFTGAKIFSSMLAKDLKKKLSSK